LADSLRGEASDGPSIAPGLRIAASKRFTARRWPISSSVVETSASSTFEPLATAISPASPRQNFHELESSARRCAYWVRRTRNLVLPGGVPSAPGVRTIRTLAWARAVLLSAGAAACLAGCITGAPIPPTYSQDELKAICERNGSRWHGDDLVGGFCARK
jgi:hypothetical protein